MSAFKPKSLYFTLKGAARITPYTCLIRAAEPMSRKFYPANSIPSSLENRLYSSLTFRPFQEVTVTFCTVLPTVYDKGSDSHLLVRQPRGIPDDDLRRLVRQI